MSINIYILPKYNLGRINVSSIKILTTSELIRTVNKKEKTVHQFYQVMSKSEMDLLEIFRTLIKLGDRRMGQLQLKLSTENVVKSASLTGR